MAYWLFKTIPERWSWEQQKAKGVQGEPWSGVRNHLASNYMKEMKKGDLGFFYHSGEERRIVGIVEVIGEYRPDPGDRKGIFGMVDIRAVADLPKPVTLKHVKKSRKLAEMVLINLSRPAIQPVRDVEWRVICRFGRLKKEA